MVPRQGAVMSDSNRNNAPTRQASMCVSAEARAAAEARMVEIEAEARANPWLLWLLSRRRIGATGPVLVGPWEEVLSNGEWRRFDTEGGTMGVVYRFGKMKKWRARVNCNLVDRPFETREAAMAAVDARLAKRIKSIMILDLAPASTP